MRSERLREHETVVYLAIPVPPPTAHVLRLTVKDGAAFPCFAVKCSLCSLC